VPGGDRQSLKPGWVWGLLAVYALGLGPACVGFVSLAQRVAPYSGSVYLFGGAAFAIGTIVVAYASGFLKQIPVAMALASLVSGVVLMVAAWWACDVAGIIEAGHSDARLAVVLLAAVGAMAWVLIESLRNIPGSRARRRR
jgi:hypothetical protein